MIKQFVLSIALLVCMGHVVVGQAQVTWDQRIGELSKQISEGLTENQKRTWRLRNSDVAGMSIVGVGQQQTFRQYDPAEIVTVLSVRDDLNADVFENGNRFIFGLTTAVSAGQSLTVTMSFVRDENQTGPPPEVFHLASEIVVGIARTGTKKSYMLHNFTFDRVGMRAGRS